MSLGLSDSFKRELRKPKIIDFTPTPSSSNLNSTLEDKLRTNNKISNSNKRTKKHMWNVKEKNGY